MNKSPKKYNVKCQAQKADSKPTKKRHKAVFALNICEKCSLRTHCQAYKRKGVFYFNHQIYLANQRSKSIYSIPEERRKLRPNVEALMRGFKTPINAGKVKVRGLVKTSIFAFSMGIAINFVRVFRYLMNNNIPGPFSDNYAFFAAKNGAQAALEGLIFLIHWLKSIFHLNDPERNLPLVL